MVIIEGDKKLKCKRINLRELVQILELGIDEVEDIVFHAFESAKSVYQDKIIERKKRNPSGDPFEEKIIDINMAKLFGQIEHNERLKQYLLYIISVPEYLDAILEEHSMMTPLLKEKIR